MTVPLWACGLIRFARARKRRNPQTNRVPDPLWDDCDADLDSAPGLRLTTAGRTRARIDLLRIDIDDPWAVHQLDGPDLGRCLRKQCVLS